MKTYIITIKCPFCGHEKEVKATEKDFHLQIAKTDFLHKNCISKEMFITYIVAGS